MHLPNETNGNEGSPVDETAPTGRDTIPDLEEVLNRAFPVLDHGFVRVVDYMGSDNAIVQAARVSYGRGTKQTSADAALIRYLLRQRHSTPFEMCEIKLHIKLPIFVARQWIRHRTANVNEYSARYSRMDREYYVPDPDHLHALLEERAVSRRSRQDQPDLFVPAAAPEDPVALAAQSTANKQGRDGALGADEAREALSRMDWLSQRAYGVYRNLLNEDDAGEKINENRSGIARELARTVLPVSWYTQFYWKSDLHNLLHFLSLRSDGHAQYEIRAYADIILEEIVERWVPVTCQAFRDYTLQAATLSAGALDVIRRRLAERNGHGDRQRPLCARMAGVRGSLPIASRDLPSPLAGCFRRLRGRGRATHRACPPRLRLCARS